MTLAVDRHSICRLVFPPNLFDPCNSNISPAECQQTLSETPCYASGPNDIWSLGIILVNLTCGRNPWKRASMEDSTFRAYRNNPRFLRSILPLSVELDFILGRIFESDPRKRIQIPELRNLILGCPRFTIRSIDSSAIIPSTETAIVHDPIDQVTHDSYSFEQYSSQSNPPSSPSYTHPVSTQTSISSRGSSVSDAGSVFSAVSSSSMSSCGSVEAVVLTHPEVASKANTFSATLPTQHLSGPCRTLDPASSSWAIQSFMTHVQVY